jgi:signal transduction histidine kinase
MEQVIARPVNATDDISFIPNDLFLKGIANGGSGMVAIVRSDDLRVVFLNNQFEYYLGYSTTDLEGPGLYFSSLLEEYQHLLLINQLRTVDDNISPRSQYTIYQVKGKNGIVKPYYLYASPIFNEAGYKDCFHHLLMLPDLSKWGMPFISFDTKEIFLEQFDSEFFGTFEWLASVDRFFWSEGVYNIYEVDEALHDLKMDFMVQYIHPNDLARVNEASVACIEGGKDMNIEFKIVTKKHNIKTIHCLAKALQNANGQTVKISGSMRDITEQRFIEENLKNKVAELNHSNRELEEFAYVASHDIQEPLRKITTFSDRLIEKYRDALTGEGALYLSRIIASAENMRVLINDLLEFSRISKTEQQFEPTNLNFILRQAMTDLELTIEETGTAIHCQELPVIDAIASQMKQLFSNIITNAMKFHKQGVSPDITIETSVLTAQEKLFFELLPNNIYYKIQVTDNGIGFEEEYATRIFQVFQRLHGKSEFPGSGIGLAICKKILEYHHGIIYAENIPGTGARFVFILPQHQLKQKAS